MQAHVGSFRVTFLGTGSGAPTAKRNLPALALSLGREVLLFDCGEGTQMQFRRAGLRPGRLSRICISHLHGDHVLGLPGFLLSLQLAGRCEALAIHGPPGLDGFIRSTLTCLEAYVGFPLAISEHAEAGTVAAGNGYTLLCRPLEHRVFCLGYALVEDPRPGRLDVKAARRLGVTDGPAMGRLKAGEPVTGAGGRTVLPEEVVQPPSPGMRIAYCTDTRPCDASVALACDADLLIHEATFTSDRAEDAHQKGHSTAREAAEVARSAGARRLALTHISPRYATADLIRNDAAPLFPGVVVAEDLAVLELPKAAARSRVGAAQR